MTNEIREFERRVLAAVGLDGVAVKSVRIILPGPGSVPVIEIAAYLRSERNIRALGEALLEFSYRPSTPRPAEAGSAHPTGTAEAAP